MIEQVAANGLSAAEVEHGKGQVRGATVLGQEDTGARMTRIAKSELNGETLPSLSQLIGRIDAVSVDDVRAVAGELLRGPATLAVIGPFDETTTFNAIG